MDERELLQDPNFEAFLANKFFELEILEQTKLFYPTLKIAETEYKKTGFYNQ